MTITATKTITQTEASIQSLQWAKQRIFKVHPEFTEDEWNAMFINMALDYARLFANCFESKAQLVYDTLTKTPPQIGQQHNWFWQWFKVKYAQDDFEYINEKVYRQPISYLQYKTYMLNNEHLEVELVSILHDKIKL